MKILISEAIDLYKNYIGHHKFIKLSEIVREERQEVKIKKKRTEAMSAIIHPERQEIKKQKLRLKRKVAQKRKRELEAMTGTTSTGNNNNIFSRKQKQMKNKR